MGVCWQVILLYVPPGDFQSIATVTVGGGGSANVLVLLLYLLPIRIYNYVLARSDSSKCWKM
jgi:hypothetical protein